jgi:hypothetical protein
LVHGFQLLSYLLDEPDERDESEFLSDVEQVAPSLHAVKHNIEEAAKMVEPAIRDEGLGAPMSVQPLLELARRPLHSSQIGLSGQTV